MLTTGDMIWNRACQGYTASTYPGDRLLAAMLRFHGSAMNGGVLHAIESCSPPQLGQAKLGFEYFGLSAVVALISKAELLIRETAEPGDFERELVMAYGSTATDQILFDRFLQRLDQAAAAFEPIQ
jgi:hypothetical protein